VVVACAYYTVVVAASYHEVVHMEKEHQHLVAVVDSYNDIHNEEACYVVVAADAAAVDKVMCVEEDMCVACVVVGVAYHSVEDSDEVGIAVDTMDVHEEEDRDP
jgi:hypothetical protein